MTQEVGLAGSVARIQPRFGRLGRLGAGLTVKISGAGTVSYSGDASVDKLISGIGQLIKR